MNAHTPLPMPANLEAEQALLGALLMNNDALRAIPTSFNSWMFGESAHAEIFEAIRKGVAAGVSVNPVTIKKYLSPKFLDERVGDLSISRYVARLTTEAVTVLNAPDYANAVTFFALRRQAISAGENATVAGFHAADEFQFLDQIKECRDQLNQTIMELSRSEDSGRTFFDDIDATLDFTAEAMAGREPIGIDPGIPELHSLTGPWREQQLIIIGGDVKTGKSACAWQTFFNIAEKHPVAGNSGEMPRAQIIMREKARRTGISAKRQALGRVSEVEMDELVRAGADMKRLHAVDIDCRQMTLDQIDEKINRLQGEHGIKAYFVDHILKLAWSGKMEDAEDFKKANRATTTLKNIAMKRNICIVALTHINKGAGSSEPYGKTYQDRLNSAMRRRPTFKNMLGNIDKDADQMIITHQARPAVAALEPEEGTLDYQNWEDAMEKVKGKAELILALSRENEFPQRREIAWNGTTTSYGPDFKRAFNENVGLF